MRTQERSASSSSTRRLRTSADPAVASLSRPARQGRWRWSWRVASRVPLTWSTLAGARTPIGTREVQAERIGTPYDGRAETACQPVSNDNTLPHMYTRMRGRSYPAQARSWGG